MLDPCANFRTRLKMLIQADFVQKNENGQLTRINACRSTNGVTVLVKDEKTVELLWVVPSNSSKLTSSARLEK